MSEQPGQTRTCPTCGNTIPAMARYCPSCGTRLDPTAAYTADDFEDALADVLDAPVEEPPADQPPADRRPADEPQVGTESPPVSPDGPTVSLPTVTATTPSQQAKWTAQANNWTEPTSQAGTWTAATPAAPPSKLRGNRTLWIILAILGFIVFCCCASFFGLLVIGANDTAFQEEISRLATLWIG